MIAQKFDILRELGKGSYGSVLLAQRRADQLHYAIKKVKIGSISNRERENAVNQIRLLASINHPHIVSYKEALFDDNQKCLYIVMEYTEKGDLLKTINLRRELRQRFPESEVWKAAGQILRGLQQLHYHKIIHRDLKSANIFISKNHYKIGDFNVSKVLKEQMARTQTGTPYYASPEIWRQMPYNEKTDIWSLGCILYEMCALKPPFVANSMAQLNYKVTKGKFQSLTKKYSKQLDKFISAMIRVNPNNRPTISELLKNQNLPESISFDRDLDRKKSSLLRTIRIPKNLKKLTHSLPSSQYIKDTSETDSTLPSVSRKKFPQSVSMHNLQNICDMSNRISRPGSGLISSPLIRESHNELNQIRKLNSKRIRILPPVLKRGIMALQLGR